MIEGIGLLFLVPIYPFFLVSTNAIAAEASRAERRGGGLGVLAGVSALSMAFGTVLGGAAADSLGLICIPAVSAATTSLALLVFVMLISMDKTNGRY